MKRQKVRKNRLEGQLKATAEKWENKSEEKLLVIKRLTEAEFGVDKSDIIERSFGKFKQKICQNSPHKMTEFIFTIANFSNQFSQKETQNALEFITVKDVKKVQNKTLF